MNRLQDAIASLRSGFEEQYHSVEQVSVLTGLACTLAFIGQTYFWPAMWHTTAFMISYTDATYVAELVCALILGVRMRRGTAVPHKRTLWISAALVQITLILYCILFEMNIAVPDPINWLFGAIFGVYLTCTLFSWFSLHQRLSASAIVWNIMIAAVFASFIIWVFTGLDGVKICVCMGVMLVLSTVILVRELRVHQDSHSEAHLEATSVFIYPPSATFLFSFAFITAISFAGFGGESTSFSAGAFFAPMLVVCAAGLLLNASAFPLTNIAVPAIVMATIAASSLHIDPVISFDLAALGMFLFLAYAVVLLCSGMRGNPRAGRETFLGLMVAFALGCIIGRACMALCFMLAADYASEILVLLSIVAANAAMIILLRRGLTPKKSQELFEAEESNEESLAATQRAAIDRIASERNLGEREKEVLVLLIEGHSANEVAQRLVIANGTAKSHIRHVYKKLGIHSRAELFQLVGIEPESH